MANDNQSSYHYELERRANDLLRVYNPTNEDYIVVWDKKSGGKVFRVRAKQEEVLFRYIAEKYIREMFQKMINDEVDKAVIKANEDRVAKGMAEMTKYAEQYRFESPLLQPTSDKARKMIAILYVGVDREYGIDNEMGEEEQTPQDKPVFESALEDIQKQKVSTPQAKAGQYKCDYPDCGFSSDKNIALLGHKRGHRTPDAPVDNSDLEAKKKEALSQVSQ